MKKSVFIVACALGLGVIVPSAHAQFLKKLKNAVETVGKEVEKATGTSQSSSVNASDGNEAARQAEEQDPELKGLYHGNLWSDAAAFIEPKVTAQTKTIVLDNKEVNCGRFSCGRALVITPSNGLFFINTAGEKVFEIPEGDYRNRPAPLFENGRMIALDSEAKKARIYDVDGKVVKELDGIREVTNFVGGVAIVTTDTYEDRYINTAGESVFPDLEVVNRANKTPRPLCDGLAAYEKPRTNLWGFRDASGKLVIEPQYEKVCDFSEGLALVCKTVGEVQKLGYIDTAGKMVIDAKYSIEPRSFHSGYARVFNKAGETFYIDKTGATVYGPFKLESFDFNNDYTWWIEWRDSPQGSRTYTVGKDFKKVAYFPYLDGSINWVGDDFYFKDINGHRYLLTAKGDEQFRDLGDFFYEDMTCVKRDDIWGYINRKGEYIVRFLENEF